MQENSPNPLSKTCRTCMTVDDCLLPLFGLVNNSKNNFTQPLAAYITNFTGLEIEEGDGLPFKICTCCARKAINLYKFKEMCKNTDKILRQTLHEHGVTEIDVEPMQSLKVELQEPDGCESQTNFNTSISNKQRTDDEESILPNIGNNQKLDSLFEDNDGAQSNVLTNSNLVTSESDETFYYTAHEVEVVTLPDDKQLPNIEEQLNEDAKLVCEIEIDDKEILCCPLCEVSFTSESDFSQHFNSHMHKKKQCDVCGKSFAKPSHLSRHLLTHDTVKPYTCKECNKGFSRLQQYSYHMNMHTGVKPHVCKQCGKGFNQMSNLKDHIRTHNGEKPFLCSVCGKGFNQLGNLRQHTIRHSGVKAHQCNICGSGFASKGELGAHTRKHTGAKPFICNICNHGFTTSSSLTKHKRIHSGEKPYECEVCHMRFSRSGILSRHRRTHTGEKPYVCPHCARAFAQSNDLVSHLRIHTGERPFICDICGQAFRQTSALKTHKKIHRKADIKAETTEPVDRS